MKMHVFKPSRVRNGRRSRSRTYSGRYQLKGDPRLTQVALGVTDKQVAERKLADIVRQKEREREGLEIRRECRETMGAPVDGIVKEWLADLRTSGRSADYVRIMENLVCAIARDAGWRSVGDISAASFVDWRARQRSKAPKTLNEYLNASRAFLNWLVRCGRIEENPLLRVKKVETRGRETRVRRAISHVEFERLFRAAPADRALVYAMAFYTGLRKAELGALRWCDVVLDGVCPIVTARGATTKNCKTVAIPLHGDLVRLLLAERGRRATESEMESILKIPRRLEGLKRDLAAAGIPFVDESGARFDFHSLRHTCATRLAEIGSSLPVTMQVMRHSDPKLTAGVYTHLAAAPLAAAVRALPGILSDDSLIDSPKTGTARQSLARDGTERRHPRIAESARSQRIGREVAHIDANCQSARMAPAVGFEPTT